MFTVLSSWQSHCESSPGSSDECRMAPSDRQDQARRLRLWVHLYRLPESTSTIECQQVEFQMNGAATEKVRRVSSVCMRGTTSIRASEERRAWGGKSAEPEVVHGSAPANWDTLEWLWSAPYKSVRPVYRWPTASPEASVVSEIAGWRRCYPNSGQVVLGAL